MAMAVLAMAAVVVSPAVASWTGLVSFARNQLGLESPVDLVVPVSLNGAALYSAVMALVATLAGRLPVAAKFRRLTTLYVLASAGFNAQNALATITAGGGVPAALFYVIADFSAVMLWHGTLTLLRADVLDEMGALESELPRFRATRWLVAPFATFGAWRTAVLEGITTPADALARRAEIKHAKRSKKHAQVHASTDVQTSLPPRVDEVTAERLDAAATDVPAEVTEDPAESAAELVEPEPIPDLAGKSKSRVIVDRLTSLGVSFDRAAQDDEYAATVRAMVPAATDWAAEQGVPMERGRGYDAVRREIGRRKALQSTERRLAVVQGGGQ